MGATLRDPRTGETWRLERGAAWVCGRLNRCEVRIADASLARQHARVTYSDGRWWLHDLGSTNGCRINGIRLDDPSYGEIVDGDVLRIGEVLLLLAVDGPPETLGATFEEEAPPVHTPFEAIAGIAWRGEHGWTSRAEAGDLLAQIALSTDPMRAHVAVAAADALLRLDPARAIPLVLAQAQQAAPSNRAGWAALLARTGDAPRIATLLAELAALPVADAYTRGLVTEAIAALAGVSDEALRWVGERLTDDDAWVRHRAARALARSASPAALELLRRVLPWALTWDDTTLVHLIVGALAGTKDAAIGAVLAARLAGTPEGELELRAFYRRAAAQMQGEVQG